MIDRAIEFATKAHEGQFRKGTRRPYIVHPIEVGDIVSTMTTDEEVISAAILHDTIEDCKGVTREVACGEFFGACCIAGCPGERGQIQIMDGEERFDHRADPDGVF